MRKFGFIVDLSDSIHFKKSIFEEAFALFSKDLTPKHLKNSHCRIITPPGESLIVKGRIVIGPIDKQEFEESSWLTDWLYFIPQFSFQKWLNYAAMIGPGPVLSQTPDIDLNNSILIPISFESNGNLTEELSECLKAIYYDEGARRIFSKNSRRLLSDEVQKNKVIKIPSHK